ncbi:MAG UNVERIFIED_CONTAM: uracil-DNA glycosylase [Rickettsiaceae bacterium]|jgi:DNA polymerase
MTKSPDISLDKTLEWYDLMEIDTVISAEKKSFIKIKKESKQNIISVSPQSSASRLLADKATNIEELREIIMSFDGCSLKKTATNTVFADGVPGAKIMLIGEAPGATEDEQGIPFCGESGKLLDNMISTIGLSRKENVYISNCIFWRPPANRRPTDEEIEICRPFLEKHIALAKPELLILVGATAVTALLGPELQISKIRQEYYNYSNQYLEKPITTTALFHPAYLLRQPYQKRSTWYDLLKIEHFLKKS